MISKKYRLKESEVKKVLHKWKPFFSSKIVLNSLSNHYTHNRFSIVIGWKSTEGSVVRNYFRRQFFSTVKNQINDQIQAIYFDFVFVVKWTTILKKSDTISDEITHLLNKLKDKPKR
jgi:ribonuclease P protein component